MRLYVKLASFKQMKSCDDYEIHDVSQSMSHTTYIDMIIIIIIIIIIINPMIHDIYAATCI